MSARPGAAARDICQKSSVALTEVVVAGSYAAHMSTEQHDRLLVHEAAQLLGITPAGVRAMHRRGALPTLEILPNGIRIFSRAVVEAVQARRIQTRGYLAGARQ